MPELFDDRRDPELFEGSYFRGDEPEDGAVTVRLLEEIAAEPRFLIHLVGEIEVAAFFENLPALRTGDLTQHPSRLVSRDRLLPDRHDITVPPHLGRLPLANVQVGSALLDDDGKELIYVGHLRKFQAPSSKHQAPRKLQIPRSKARRFRAGFAVWCLELLCSLELGASFRDRPFLLHPRFRLLSGNRPPIVQRPKRI